MRRLGSSCGALLLSLVFVSSLVAVSLGGCTKKQSRGSGATPADVDVEWPDAAPMPSGHHDEHEGEEGHGHGDKDHADGHDQGAHDHGHDGQPHKPGEE